MGHYTDAGELLRPALEIQLATLGENNIEVACTMVNLAAVSAHEGLHAEAESLYRRAIEIFERARGLNDEQVAWILLDYAWVLRQTGRKSEGRKLESHARAILAVHKKDDRTRLTVDMSDLLSPRR